MKHRTYLKCLACFLSVTLCFTLFSPLAEAAENSHGNDSNSGLTGSERGEERISEPHLTTFDPHDPESINDKTILVETMDRRNFGEKHFRLRNGSNVAVQYGYQVHEPDGNGGFQDIDNQLTEAEDDLGRALLKKASGSQQVVFSYVPLETEALLTITDEHGRITWTPANEMRNGNAEVSYAAPFIEENKTKLFSPAFGGVVSYKDLLSDTDYLYQLTGNNVKETLVVKSKDAFLASGEEYRFTLTLLGLTAGYDPKENVIEIRNHENEVVRSIEAPYMTDASGLACNAIALALKEEGKETVLNETTGLPEEMTMYTVTLTPDREWLTDPERTYPVHIDPTIVCRFFYTAMMQSTSVCTKTPDSNSMYQYGEMYIGRTSAYLGNVRGAFKLNCLPTLTEADTVIDASVRFRVKTYSGVAPVTANLHAITENVTIGSLTWNNIQGKYSGTVLDTQTISSTDVGADKYWDITKIVKEWYLNGSNYGLTFISENEDGHQSVIWLCTSTCDYVPTDRMPKLFVSYLNQEGLEDYLTYHSAGSGSMGTISVGDFNGNLVYTYTDIAMTGNSVPAMIQHVYNHDARNKADAAGPDPSLTDRILSNTARYGSGFRLNISQRIDPVKTDGGNGLGTTYPYAYTDADGTVHYFLLSNGTAGETGSTYVKEYETTTVLTKTLSGFTLDPTGTLGGTTVYDFNDDGFLIAIRDTVHSGKTQTITYTQNKPTKVTDGEGRETVLSYDTTPNSSTYDHLTSITDPAGRSTTYAYTNGRLSSITVPDGNAVTLTYSLHQNETILTAVTDYDGSKILAEYYDHAPYRTKKLTECGTDASEGRRLTFVYGSGETTVTDREGRSETMMFDNSGHTVSIRDGEGNAAFMGYHANSEVLGGSSIAENPDSGNNNRHSLTVCSDVHASVRNYLTNAGFEYGTTGWNLQSTGWYGTGLQALEGTMAYEGKKCLKFDATGFGDGIAECATIPGVRGKTVIFSGYVSRVNNNETNGFDTGIDLQISYKNSSNNWMTTGKGIYFAAGVDRGYERFTVSTTVPLDAYTEEITVAVVNVFEMWSTLYFDSLQLEVSSTPSRVNLIENGSFSGASGTFLPYGWSSSNLSSGTDFIATGRTEQGYRITGNKDTEKALCQTVNVKNGQAGDRFVFSAWAKAASLIRTDKTQGAGHERDFGMEIRFIHSDDSYDSEKTFFEARTENWQYLSGSATAESAYVKVEVRLLYGRQKNTAVFDDVELFRDGFGDRYTYDTEGRVTSVADHENRVTGYTYLGSGRPEVSRIDHPDGTYETFTYDSTTRQLLSSTDSSGLTTNYTYDMDGNPTGSSATATIGNGTKTYASGTTAYSDGYVSSFTDNRGNSVSYSYTLNKGLLSSVTDPLNVTTSYTYNAYNDDLLSVSTAGSTLSYAYDTYGRMTSMSHNTTSSPASDVTYGFTYDVFGNRTSTKVGTATLASYQYAPYNGELTSTTYANGVVAENTYDSLGRLIALSYNDIDTYRWYYGTDGRIGLVEDLENNTETRYEYDLNGRLTTLTKGSGGLSRFEYDDTTGYLVKDGLYIFENFFGEKYTYTPQGNASGVKMLSDIDFYFSTASIDDSFTTPHATYELAYDTFHRLSVTTAVVHGSTLETTYSYSNGTTNQMTTGSVSELHFETNGSADSLYYSYDSRGNITSVSSSSGDLQESTYIYDSLNRVVRENDLNANKTITYEYDLGGNLTGVMEYAYTTGSLTGLTPTATHTYTYGDSNWKDKLTAFDNGSITYDAIGNPLTYYDGKTLTWQKGRQLSSVTIPGNNGSTTISYIYDEDGNRISKSDGATTVHYLYQNGRIVAAGTGLMGSPTYYFYDENGSPIGCMSDEYNYYLYVKNLQGDVIAIVDPWTHEIETIYDYDAYGKVIAIRGNRSLGVDNIYRYRGYVYDSETGLYYAGGRYYDPNTGRWLNADGLLSTGQGTQGANMYAYCLGNPVMMGDLGGAKPYFIDADGNIVEGDVIVPKKRTFLESLLLPAGYFCNRTRRVYIVEAKDKEHAERLMRDGDVLVIDYRNHKEKDGTPNPDMQIRDSCLIRSETFQKEIISVMQDYNNKHPNNPAWVRTNESMLWEWNFHNELYYWKEYGRLFIWELFKDNTRHCDLDNIEEGLNERTFINRRIFKWFQ